MSITGLVSLVSMPCVSLLLVALGITSVVVLSYKLLVDQDEIRNLRERMKQIKQKVIEVQKRKDMEELNRLLEEMSKINFKYMKHTIKPMIVSLAILVTVFPLLSKAYTGMAVAKLPFEAPLIGDKLSWIAWYVLASLTVGWVIRRALGVDE